MSYRRGGSFQSRGGPRKCNTSCCIEATYLLDLSLQTTVSMMIEVEEAVIREVGDVEAHGGETVEEVDGQDVVAVQEEVVEGISTATTMMM